MVDEDEAARLFPAVYDAVRGQIPGAVDRSELKWRLNIVGDADWMRPAAGRSIERCSRSMASRAASRSIA